MSGVTYRSKSKAVAWSRFNDPIPRDGKPHGNSREWGDASPEVKNMVIDALVEQSIRQGLTKQETAHVLAIANAESGFNPDAAAKTSSASGIGQFIDKTGKSYSLGDHNRFDIDANAKALVSHFVDNRELAESRGKGADHIYKYHHDGPSADSGGLALSRNHVMPQVKQFSVSEHLADFSDKVKEIAGEVRDAGKAAYAALETKVRDTAKEIGAVLDSLAPPKNFENKRTAGGQAREPAKEPKATAVGTTEMANVGPEKPSANSLIESARDQGLPADAIAALVRHRMGGQADAESALVAQGIVPASGPDIQTADSHPVKDQPKLEGRSLDTPDFAVARTQPTVEQSKADGRATDSGDSTTAQAHPVKEQPTLQGRSLEETSTTVAQALDKMAPSDALPDSEKSAPRSFSQFMDQVLAAAEADPPAAGLRGKEQTQDLETQQSSQPAKEEKEKAQEAAEMEMGD